MNNAREIFLNLIADNRKGIGKGVYSVCSANSSVLNACICQAKEDGSILLIESTSNQVDQFGGYTGMRPSDFISYVQSIADKVDFPGEMILFGGDHLGPNAWQNISSEEAMANSEVLIEEYVKAGYQKIHIDTSMFCVDDKGDRSKPLADEIVASRTVRLARVAENAWKKYCSHSPEPVYIIGTEVPVPGGAQEDENVISVTSPEDAAKSILVTKKHFIDEGLERAWRRVVGVVVQPGVEFGDNQIFKYKREEAKNLSKIISNYEKLVFEVHSTDYQTESDLKNLVEDHFCILKVGPWLTFAFREALFALEAMEKEILGENHRDLSNLWSILENVMNDEPKYWKKYYPGDKKQQLFKRKYSFSDRSRYYWPTKELDFAKKKLFKNLRENKIPLSLLSQFMSVQFYEVCNGNITVDPDDLVNSYIRIVAGIYSRACGLSN